VESDVYFDGAVTTSIPQQPSFSLLLPVAVYWNNSKQNTQAIHGFPFNNIVIASTPPAA